MTIALRIRAQSVSPAFLSATYVGELVQDLTDAFEISKVCIAYEMMEQRTHEVTKKPYNDLVTRFVSNESFTNGVLQISKSDVLWSREVSEEEVFHSAYVQAFDALRLERLKLVQVQDLSQVNNSSVRLES